MPPRKRTTKRTTKRTSAKKRTTAKRSTTKKRSTTRKRSSTSSALTSAQKTLKERTQAPWERLQSSGYTNPTIYSFPWEERSLATLSKAEYFPGIGYVTDSPHSLLGDYSHRPYSWESFVSTKTSGDTSTMNPEGTSPGMFVLRDDQKEDVSTILTAYKSGAPEFLIASGTGVGKTVTTLAAVDEINPSSVLIVCPAAVIPVWRRHIEQMGDKGRTYVVMNYESLKKTIKPPAEAVAAKKTSTQNKHISAHGEPYALFDVVIVDEAHKTKNPTAQQTKIVNKYATGAKFVLKLSATPGKDPSQLHHLWRLLSWNTGDDVEVTEDKDMGVYVSWCQDHGVGGIVPAPFGNGITFEGGDDDVRTFEKLLYGENIHGVVGAVKRIPGEWLPTVREPYPVEISGEDAKAYELLVEDVKKHVLSIRSGARKDLSKGIAAMMRLRQKAGLLKARHIVDYTDYCIDDLGEQVVISTVFHGTADTISELLEEKNIPHVVITGRNTAEEKEAFRLQFQRGEVPVVVTSITTGISLHRNEKSVGGNSAPRRMIIGDIHYSPVEQTQLEGRINRNGENGVITFPLLSDTADEKVVSRLLTGMRTQSILQSSGDEDDLEFLASALGV